VYSDGPDMKISWTVPLVYCGNYSCMSGVIAAEVNVRTIDLQCIASGNTNAGLEYGENQDLLVNVAQDGRGVIFLVNSFSGHFPEQQGFLLSSSTEAKLGVPAQDSDQQTIKLASQAILHKYGSWDSPALQNTDELFSVQWSAVSEGRFLECEKTTRSEDCFKVGTQSIVMDNSTRWLAVVALPASIFNAPVVEKKEIALNEINTLWELSKRAVNQARVAMACVFVGVAAVSIAVGLWLGCTISEPLRNLSALMQLLGNLKCMRETDAFKPLRSGRRSRIKDISALEETFCTSLRAIEDFARFVPQSVVQRIVDNKPRATHLHVDKKEVTIMFCTIKDFAPIVSSSPQFASKCYAVMTQIAEEFKGTVSEILSDGVLVYWNTPDHVSNHKAWACAAALSIKQAIQELNELENGPGSSPLKVQIGLNSGTVLAGNIGSDKFMKFGCLGDAVNLASRVHGLCNIFGVPIVASSATVAELVESHVFFTRRLARVTVQGRREPTETHELLGRETAEQADNAASTPKFVFREEPSSQTPTSNVDRAATPWRTPCRSGSPRPCHTVADAIRNCMPCAGLAHVAKSPTALGAGLGAAMNPGKLVHLLRENRESSPRSCAHSDKGEDTVPATRRDLAREYEEALEAYERRDFKHAKAVAAKLAEGGSVPAQRLIERVEEVEQEERDLPEEERPPWTRDWPVTKKK